MYSIASDEWVALPALEKAVYSASCLQTKNCLLVIGGFDVQDQLTSSIQRLNMEDTNASWQVLKIQLPKPMSDVGLMKI